MFRHVRMIQLRDTDATGVLYFADQFKIALETLEFFLKKSGTSLGIIIDKENFLLPIVHAESDYLAPLRVGDEVEITLSVKKIGTSSFTLHYAFHDKEKQIPVGSVSIVHVTVSKETKKSIPIPQLLADLLTS